MSITLGVYDIFTYAIPGASYLALIAYVAGSLHWVNISRIVNGNTTLLVIGAALACYLTGHVSYALGRALNRIIRAWQKNMDDAREEFAVRVPSAKDRSFLHADRGTLQSGIELHGMDAALEMIRLRAISLMLRNVTPAFLIAAIVATIGAIRSESPTFGAVSAVVFLLAAVGSFWQAARMGHWANMKTLELSFWLPGIDDAFATPADQLSKRAVPSPSRTTSKRGRTTPEAPGTRTHN